MSFDSDSGYWHMTREGWLRQDTEPFPSGRIETWKYSMKQSYPTQPEHHDFWLEWTDDAVSAAERDQIREQLGMPYKTKRGQLVVCKHFPENTG